jgi:hypothetical protein
MKNKLRMVCKYLKGLGLDKIGFRAEFDESGIQYLEIDINHEISDTIESIIDEIIESYQDKFYENGPGTLDSGNEWYNVYGDIIPGENKIIFNNIDFSGYATEDSGSYYDFDDYNEGDRQYDIFLEIQKFLNEIKKDSIRIIYNGSGDSGWVENYYQSDSGKGKLPEHITHLAYELLEDFGGWEINEGSQGVISISNNEIEIEHEWNTMDEYNEPLNIVITPETFNEQSK